MPDDTLPVPASLMTLLACFAPLFTAPSFRTFCGLACGFLTQPGRRTVCGMLSGAGLARLWSHDRAHRFFSGARWDPDELGLAVARMVVRLLVPDGEPVLVAVDDTLFRRRGKKVWAASWFHDGSVQGPVKTGRGNNWVVMAIIVRLPFCDRPVALPALAKLVVKGTNSASRLWLARRMADRLAAALPGRRLHVVADSAYAGAELGKLGKDVTWTTRLRKDAALHGLPPARVPERRAGPASVGTGCRPWPGSPPPRNSRRSLSPVTARERQSAPPWSPACGTPSSAPATSRWYSPATSRPQATTWPWSPRTWARPRRRSSSAMPRDGALRSRSATRSRNSASDRPATASRRQSAAPRRSSSKGEPLVVPAPGRPRV